MKNFFLLAFGALFLNVATVSAVEYDNVLVPQYIDDIFDSCSDSVTQTPLTQRIEEDEEDAFGRGYSQPLITLARMLRSIPEGECDYVVRVVGNFANEVTYKINNNIPVAVFGRSPDDMARFTKFPIFYYGGK